METNELHLSGADGPASFSDILADATRGSGQCAPRTHERARRTSRCIALALATLSLAACGGGATSGGPAMEEMPPEGEPGEVPFAANSFLGSPDPETGMLIHDLDDALVRDVETDMGVVQYVLGMDNGVHTGIVGFSDLNPGAPLLNVPGSLSLDAQWELVELGANGEGPVEEEFSGEVELTVSLASQTIAGESGDISVDAFYAGNTLGGTVTFEPLEEQDLQLVGFIGADGMLGAMHASEESDSYAAAFAGAITGTYASD